MYMYIPFSSSPALVHIVVHRSRSLLSLLLLPLLLLLSRGKQINVDGYVRLFTK